MIQKISYLCSALVLITSPFWLPLISDGLGTDDQAMALVENIQQGYVPWASELISLSSDWMEGVLFSVQIALGIALLFWGLKKIETLKPSAVRNSPD